MSVGVPVGRPFGRPTSVIGKLPGRQLSLLLLVLLLSAAVGYYGYERYLASNQSAPALQTAPVKTGSLVTTVTATGNVVAARQAKLSFATSGKLTELDVNVGDSVTAGQTLAKVDPQSFQIKVNLAQAALDSAKLQLQQLMNGATPQDRAAAQAAYNAAVAKLSDTAAGATPADLAAAQAAADQAKATLDAAQVKLDQLKSNTYTSADWAAAQSAIDSDKASLKGAQSKLKQLLAGPQEADIASAQAAVDQAKAAMATAEDRYQMAQNGDLQASGASSNSAAAEAYTSAKSEYDSAVQKLQQLMAGPLSSDVVSAQSAVDQAQANLNSAQAKLDLMGRGPAPTDLSAAQSAVDQAQASLNSAQAKLDQLKAGPTATDLQAAKSGVAGAQADLITKTSPPTDTAVGLAQKSVDQAQANLDQAKLDLANATLVAPFDGLVAAVGPNVGEQVGSAAAVVTLVDPKSVRIDATVDESDVAKLAVGQQATVTFDALPGYQPQGKVIAIAPSGTTTQGVVSYQVSVGITNPDRPLPEGMSASLNIETSRKDNVLLVPNRAIHSQGQNRTVEVLAGEKTETVPVKIGASNDQMTEVVSGLQAGEQVVIPATTIRAPNVNVGGPGFGGGFRAVGR